jgi:hypothetical protein
MCNAALAQLVEHRIRNAGVVGSNPISGTIFTTRLIQRMEQQSSQRHIFAHSIQFHFADNVIHM